MAKRKTSSDDSVVIYWSEQDKRWIAHSLRTDQIGTGSRIVDALADVLKPINFIYQEAQKDQTLAILREAPKDIRNIARTAKKLPREIYEVAHKMVHGTWPEHWDPPQPRGKTRAFTARIEELVR